MYVMQFVCSRVYQYLGSMAHLIECPQSKASFYLFQNQSNPLRTQYPRPTNFPFLEIRIKPFFLNRKRKRVVVPVASLLSSQNDFSAVVFWVSGITTNCTILNRIQWLQNNTSNFGRKSHIERMFPFFRRNWDILALPETLDISGPKYLSKWYSYFTTFFEPLIPPVNTPFRQSMVPEGFLYHHECFCTRNSIPTEFNANSLDNIIRHCQNRQMYF